MIGPSTAQDKVLKNELPYGRHRSAMPLHLGSWERGEMANWKPWQEAFRNDPEFPRAPTPQNPAEDVLLALTRYTPQFNALAQAAERPLTRFPYHWRSRFVWSGLMYPPQVLQNLSVGIRMRAVANIDAGHTPEGARDLALMLRLRQAAAADTLLVGHLFNLTLCGLATEPGWEGLATRCWSAAELSGLQGKLAQIDLLSDYVAAIRRERAVFFCHGLAQVEGSQRQRELATMILGLSSPNGEETWLRRGVAAACAFAPRGWFLMGKASGCRYYQEYVIDAVDPAKHRVAVEKTMAGSVALRSVSYGPSSFFAGMILPSLEPMSRRTAHAQAEVDQMIAACALERFYIDHQAYPDGLYALVPSYLDRVPTDVIDGASMRYRRTDDGRYLLYSVGWDDRDGGGQVAWREGPRLDDQRGDWVWQYRELQPPPEIQRSK